MGNLIKILTLLLLALIIGGCASQPVPEDLLAEAKAAIADAESQNAVEHAPLALRFAREKLAAAQLAVERRRYDEAARFAEQTIVNCEVAVAKTAAAKAREASRKQEELNNRLKADLGAES